MRQVKCWQPSLTSIHRCTLPLTFSLFKLIFSGLRDVYGASAPKNKITWPVRLPLLVIWSYFFQPCALLPRYVRHLENVAYLGDTFARAPHSTVSYDVLYSPLLPTSQGNHNLFYIPFSSLSFLPLSFFISLLPFFFLIFSFFFSLPSLFFFFIFVQEAKLSMCTLCWLTWMITPSWASWQAYL